MKFRFHLHKSGLKYWLVTVLLILSVFAVDDYAYALVFDWKSYTWYPI